MAIAGIPMPLGPWESFDKGFGFNNDLMKQILERRQLKQKADQYKELLALKKAAAGRASQAAADAHRIAMNKLDPTYEARQYEALENYFRNKGKPPGGQANGAPMGNVGAPQALPPEMATQDVPAQEMGEGMGMYSPEGLQSAQQQPSFVPSIETPQPPGVATPSALPGNVGGPDLELMKANPELRAWYKKHYKIDPLAVDKENALQGAAREAADLEKLRSQVGENSPAYKNALSLFNSKIKGGGEPPELKRANDLRDKLAQDKYKHELKLAEKQQENDLKNEQTKQKTINSAKNDLPHLEETLRGLEYMKKIADDPSNEDLFNHWVEGHEMAAKRSSNPNAGAWQIYGLGPIIDAENKMSSKGNIVALKAALNMKANFAEKRVNAQSKLHAQIDQVKHRIEETKRVAGMSSGGLEKVIVIDPSGKKFETTKENAAHLPDGWKHG